MKKKIIIISLLSALLSVIIYFYTKNDELTLVSIGDGLSCGMTPYDIEGYSFNDYLKEDYISKHKLKQYISEFAHSDITIKELIYEIKENKSITIKNEEIEIQRAINEADVLTIAIGMDELANKKITNKVKEEFKEDIEELLSMIKMLNHNEVIVIGLYPTNKSNLLPIMKLNAIIRDIAITNNFEFVDISSIYNNFSYFPSPNSHYINYQGHKAIYETMKDHLRH